jgi:hypothetical protein
MYQVGYLQRSKKLNCGINLLAAGVDPPNNLPLIVGHQ